MAGQQLRVPAGGGPEVQVTRGGGFAAFESSMEPGLFFSRFDEPGLWHVPSEGGSERKIFGEPRCWGQWAVGPDALYVISSDPGGESLLSKLNPRTGRATRVLTLPSVPPCGESAPAASPDGRSVPYSTVSEQSDIFLVEAAHR